MYNATTCTSVVAERSSALYSSSGVIRMWVRIPAWPVAALVSLSKTLNHNCFVLRMGRKAVGPVCCVMHVKEPRTLIVKEKGLAPVFLDSRLEHPAGWIFWGTADWRASKRAFRFLCVLAGALSMWRLTCTCIHAIVFRCPWVHGSVAPENRHCQQ